MTALSHTHAIVCDIAQHAPTALTRHRALLLDQQLTACATTPSPARLRQIVIATRDLAGPGWLTAHASDPAISAFTHLDTLTAQPPLPILDHTLTSCLQARFPSASTTPPPHPDGPSPSNSADKPRHLPAKVTCCRRPGSSWRRSWWPGPRSRVFR